MITMKRLIKTNTVKVYYEEKGEIKSSSHAGEKHKRI